MLTHQIWDIFFSDLSPFQMLWTTGGITFGSVFGFLVCVVCTKAKNVPKQQTRRFYLLQAAGVAQSPQDWSFPSQCGLDSHVTINMVVRFKGTVHKVQGGLVGAAY